MVEVFSAQVSAQVRMVDRRLKATLQQSAQRVIQEAQRPRPSGRMPVVTGFLRHSGQISIKSLTSFGDAPQVRGATRGAKKGSYAWDQADVVAKIARTEPGDLVFFGWTAAYARRMEAMYGFQRGAVEKWQSIVAEEGHRARELIK